MRDGEYRSVRGGQRDVIRGVGTHSTPKPPREPDAPEHRTKPPSSWTTEQFQSAVQDAVRSAIKAREDSGPKRRRWRDSMVPHASAKKKEPYELVVMALKWITAGISTIFAAGVLYSQAVAHNATKSDLLLHNETDLAPVRDRLHSLEDQVEKMRATVEKLSHLEETRRQLEVKIRRLNTYRSEYQEALSEYAAAKAAGKAASRPRKTQAHLDLEAELEAL